MDIDMGKEVYNCLLLLISPFMKGHNTEILVLNSWGGGQ